MRFLYFLTFITLSTTSLAQLCSLAGVVRGETSELSSATIRLEKTKYATVADSGGLFHLASLPAGSYRITVTAVGYEPYTASIQLRAGQEQTLYITLEAINTSMEGVVITGTLKPVRRVDSPIPIEVYSPKYFQKNPTACLFDAVGTINGVRPQLNCNICNTGDIHINGMEGPYTLILIDGMPIVSGLSTVYGLSGIPNSLVERLEVVKGPAASLYGSEAMGGIINVITKDPAKAPQVSADVFGTSWQEYNADLSFKTGGKALQNLTGINYYHYQHPYDKNRDGFTDITLQKRASLFNKTSWARPDNKVANLALRFVEEDRWGGQMAWSKTWRGSDSIYGESIYTRRWEVIGNYQLPVKEKIIAQASYNHHRQDSYYGTVPYAANQQVSFAQLYWDKQLSEVNSLLTGASYRFTYYDDNTPATASADGKTNRPQRTPLPGAFVQDEWTLKRGQKLLLGYRFDHDKTHGAIHSPRIAYKWSPNSNHTIRASFGTGFRVVNLFTEDHAALTGAREVVIRSALKPEKSYNGNVNYTTAIKKGGFSAGIDITAFYSYFTNKIVGDFDSDPNKIIYDNLTGHAVSRGISLNNDISVNTKLKIFAGITFQDVYQRREAVGGKKLKLRQLHAPQWSGNFTISYNGPQNFVVDITGQWNGAMRLPVQPADYRPSRSPAFALINIQVVKKLDGMELYAGVKNILNFIPKYALMRPFDPFDKSANDPVTNPNGYTFDTEYNFAPLQGIKGFAGVRYSLFKKK